MSKWHKDELEFLKENYKTMTFKEIGLSLNRNENSIRSKAAALGLKKNNRAFTTKQIKFLKDNYSIMDVREIANKLNIPEASVYSLATYYGLKKESAKRKWTEKELVELKRNYGIMTNKELAKLFNRTLIAINMKLKQLKSLGMLSPRKKLIMEELL